MRVVIKWVKSTETWGRALLISAAVSLVYTGLVLGYTYLLSPSVTITGPLWGAVAWYSLMAFGTVGIPILLWLRFDLRSPAVLLAGILLFWHVLVVIPPLGSDQGDAPGFTFVFFWMPFYLVAYALLAGGEYSFRNKPPGIPLQ